jgi:hypothetical protein
MMKIEGNLALRGSSLQAALSLAIQVCFGF